MFVFEGSVKLFGHLVILIPYSILYFCLLPVFCLTKIWKYVPGPLTVFYRLMLLSVIDFSISAFLTIWYMFSDLISPSWIYLYSLKITKIVSVSLAATYFLVTLLFFVIIYAYAARWLKLKRLHPSLMTFHTGFKGLLSFYIFNSHYMLIRIFVSAILLLYWVFAEKYQVTIFFILMLLDFLVTSFGPKYTTWFWKLFQINVTVMTVVCSACILAE